MAPQLVVDNTSTADTPEDQLWSWYERQSDKVKAEAHRRLAAVDALAALAASGMTRSASAAMAAREHKVSTATIWNWEAAVRPCTWWPIA